MRSQNLKYEEIIKALKEKNKNFKIGLEIVDEYHNIITSSVERFEQLDIVSYLENNIERTDGTIFYSASNKNGQILSSFDENLFGKLLCKVNRNELRVRGIVCPKLVFKIIKVKSKSNSAEIKRNAKRKGVDLDKAQSETVGIITAFNDAKKYYEQPNIITFGDHVEGCRFISKNDEMKKYLPDVKNHFMAAETTNAIRDSIMDEIRNSGNNILHQHSVAKEGINIPNLHAAVFGRNMNIIGTQQAIGRPDRALIEDTINFQKGLLSLDEPKGWKKYYNLIYLIVNSDDDDAIKNRISDIVKFLLNSGIPEEEWDITVIDDNDKNKVEIDIPDFATTIPSEFNFDPDNIKKMIERVKIEIVKEEKRISEELIRMKKDEEFDNMSWENYLNEFV
jgi:superfamily II DNA or RNA helicase